MKRLVFLVIAFAAVALQGQTPSAHDRWETIKQKYPWGSLYLTSRNLSDLYLLLHGEGAKSAFSTFVENTPDAKLAVSLVDGFISQRRGSKTEAVSFLRLDMALLRAGYMTVGQPGGSLIDVPWSKDDVKKVILWADTFVNHALLVSTTAAALRTQSDTIDQSWEKLAAIKANPLTSPLAALDLDFAFRLMLMSRANDLAELRKTNPALHTQLTQFATEVDKRLLYNREVLAYVPDYIRSGTYSQ